MIFSRTTGVSRHAASSRSLPVVVTFADYYLPGYKAGGSLRTIANMVAQLGKEFRFRIVTRDRDLGDATAYPGIVPDEWRRAGDAEVLYTSVSGLAWRRIAALLRSGDCDVVYLNSLFSVAFTFRPLLIRRLVARHAPVVLAPRGELARGALALSRWKKRVYLRFLRATGLLTGVTWQASSEHEQVDIRRVLASLGITAPRIIIAPDLPPPAVLDEGRAGEHPPVAKTCGSLRLVFLARISPMKNLIGAIDALRGVKGDVSLDIYGPVEDTGYWAACERAIGTLGPDVRVSYHGPLPPERVAATLEAHHVLIQPSFGENFGHSILEAMTAGCPVVISDRTPWRGLAPARAGLDVPIDDVASLRTAIERFRDMPAEEFSAWRRGARRYATDVSTDNFAVDQCRGLFRAAAASRRPDKGHRSS